MMTRSPALSRAAIEFEFTTVSAGMAATCPAKARFAAVLEIEDSILLAA
jgi:hypothetical protein